MSAERQVSGTVEIDASPGSVFALVADPRRHHEFDGSGTVRSTVTAPTTLSKGSTFTTGMVLGLPYVMRNTVTEFEQDRRVAWRTLSGVVWRYELEPLDGGTRTRVTETWDAGRSWAWPALRLAKFPEVSRRSIAATLPRLAALVTG